MVELRFSLKWFYFLFFLISIFFMSASPYKIPRLSHRRPLPQDPQAISTPSSVSPDDFETHYYQQTLDHFNYGPESYATFKQKYVINTKYWGGANASSPIFANLGGESSLGVLGVAGIDFPNNHAPHFKALIVYIEHRYYGESNPFGTMEEAMKNKSTRGYLNSAQAIADYAEVLLYLKEKYNSPNSPIVVIGCSYAGMLAAWFRLKYPHVAIGSLASSAPILYFDNITPQDGYYSVITKHFRETSESCYRTIKKSWYIIDKIAAKPNGLSVLSHRFNTCSPLNTSFELKDFLDTIYAAVTQYNEPPTYPLSMVCRAIDGAPKGTDILGRIYAGVVAAFSRNANISCYNTSYFRGPHLSSGFHWQMCSEMVFPIGHSGNATMFQPAAFKLKEFIKNCQSVYGVPPRPHWVTTYYGGHDIKLVLQKFASNIIFSNGLTDPYSSGGVLEDLSDSLLAVHTANGSHCLDVHPANQTTDPEWLVMQRKIEVQIIEGWIQNYYADLLSAKYSKKLN